MFKKTDPTPQYELFSTPSTQLGTCGSKKYDDPKAWHNQFYRFEIIHNTFRHFLKGLGENRNTLLNPKLRKLIDAFEQEDAQGMVYRLNSESIEAKLSSLGLLIYQVLKRLNEKTIGYDLLHRVFYEQYEVVKGVAIPRPKEEISAQSVQNHNDPDAPYRKKGDQKIKGYSVNITEICNDKDDDC